MRLRMMIGALLAAAALAPVAGATSFTSPVKLTGATGGEPSIATNQYGDVFVSGPQGIPAEANNTDGVGFWASHNDGTSFGSARLIGSGTGGGDSDLLWSQNALYVADLEASTAQLCKSTDRGNTFFGIGPAPDPNHCTTTNGGQAGPSDDREWLTAAPDGTLYLTYHEFVSAEPVAFRSDNAGGDDFSNACGPLVTDPTIQANVPTDITGGTLVAKPVTDAQGNLYVLFSTTTQHENALAQAQGQPSGTFSQLYLAVSHDKCHSFTDYTVFDGEKRYGENTVQFGDIFNDLAIDGAGNLYTIGAGYIGHTQFAATANVYMFRSTDQGQHWSPPTRIGTSNAAHMLPAAIGGPRAGQLSVGYFRTVNGVTDPNSTTGQWTYTAARSTDASSSSPSFAFSDVSPGTIYHKGDVCNQGILCGTVPGGPSDRSLLDFTSAAVDKRGCTLYTFAANPTGSPGNNNSSNTFNYVTRQTSGCFSTAASGNGNRPTGTGKGGPLCPKPSGHLGGRNVGRLAVGMTRSRARHLMPHFTQTRNGFDHFCLRAGWAIRAGYATNKALHSVAPRQRRRYRGRIVVALTANRFYALNGVRPRTKVSAVRKKLHLGRPFHVGLNYWYLVREKKSNGVLKVRHGRIEEIGLAARTLTRSRVTQRRFFRSMTNGA